MVNVEKILAEKPEVKKVFTPARLVQKSQDNGKALHRQIVVNTCGILDSHLDLHVPGLWDDCLEKKPNLAYIQEHKMKLSKIISEGEDLKAYTKAYLWKDLGFDFRGYTEALVFDVKIRKERNQFMFSQFKNNFVKENSVGMRYVNLLLCVNDKDYPEEFSNWQKYAPMVVNKEALSKTEYFFAVTKAEVLEGSAVPRGSNKFTPVLSEVGADEIDYKWLTKNFKISC